MKSIFTKHTVKRWSWKLLLLIGLCLSLSGFDEIHAQQYLYQSNFREIKFLHNPALPAFEQTTNGGIFLRRQWVGYGDAPRSALAYMNSSVPDINMGGGAFLLYDKLGMVTQFQFGLNYHYWLTPGFKNNDQLAFGLGASLGTFQFNRQGLLAQHPDDPLLPPGDDAIFQPNFSAGILYSAAPSYKNGWRLGIGAQQAIPLDGRLDNSPANFKKAFHANALLANRHVWDLVFLDEYVQGEFSAANVYRGEAGLTFEMYDAFWSGIALSTDLSLELQIGFIKTQFTRDASLRIGAAGRFALQSRSRERGPGFEVMVIMQQNPEESY